ncbi:Biorientation of chromosomes in cell division protein 1 [Schistosoma japonicum]|nr:Biorientation of chromosomes in cell division protein 1 [Schistosoma japonicum]
MELSSQRSQIASHIVDQIKSQGLFDKIRKQCLEDVDVNMNYQMLQKKVNSFVLLFLQNQSWNPGIEKLKLREQLRTKLLHTKMLSYGVDKLVRHALNAKMPRSFKNQVQNIVCDYFDLNPELLLVNNLDSQNCGELRPTSFPENPAALCSTDAFDRGYSCTVINNPVAIPAPQCIQPPFPYSYPPVPVQHPVIQPSVPCPITTYVGPNGNYMVPPPPPPGVFCQPLVHFGNQLSVPPQNFQTSITHNVSPTVNQSDIEHVRTQPLEVTVEESVPCDDPMDIESLNSNSPVDECTISSRENSEPSEVTKDAGEKNISQQSNHTAWHDVPNDVCKDEGRNIDTKSQASFSNSGQYSKYSPVPRSPYAIPKLCGRTLSVMGTISRDIQGAEDRIFPTSPVVYNENKYTNKCTKSTLEYNTENHALSLKTESSKFHSEQKLDFSDSSLTTAPTKHMNHNHTKYLRPFASPFPTTQSCDMDDGRTTSTMASSRIEVNHSGQSINRSRSISIKKHPSFNPASQFTHFSDERSHSYYTKSPNGSVDRRSKSNYSSCSSVFNRFRSSPDSVAKMRTNKSYPTITPSCEWARNESRSPEEHSSRSSSMFSQSNYSLSSASERLTPDPTVTLQLPNSSSNKIHEADGVNSCSPDFAFDRLIRKREIEARLKEIESTERKLLSRKKTQSYGKESRQSTNCDVELRPDYKLSRKYMK